MLTVLTPASTHDLTVLATVKTELSISGTSDDAKIGVFIRQASELLAGYCNVPTFALEEVEETFRGLCGDPCLILSRHLVPTVSEVIEDGVTLDAALYELDGWLLYRLDANDERICWDARKVVVTYEAGFALLDTLPYAIERAALDLVVGLYRGQGRDQSIRSEQTEGVGETQYFDGRRPGIPPLAQDRLAALDRYRRVSLA